jgi:hypothetical protein
MADGDRFLDTQQLPGGLRDCKKSKEVAPHFGVAVWWDPLGFNIRELRRYKTKLQPYSM